MSLIKHQLEASLAYEETMALHAELNNDPGIQAHRSACTRLRPDLANKSDTDVLEWLQRVETNAAEFFDEYGQSPSSRAFEEYAEELVDNCKRLIITIQDMRERHGDLG